MILAWSPGNLRQAVHTQSREEKTVTIIKINISQAFLCGRPYDVDTIIINPILQVEIDSEK